MKTFQFPKIMAVVVCLASLPGCAKDEKPQVKETQPVDKKSVFRGNAVLLVQQVIERYNAHDLSGVVALFTPNIEWVHRTATKPVVRGRPQLARHLMRERGIFPDSQIAVRRILEFEKLVVVEGVFRATHKGVAQGMNAAGKKVSYDVVYFFGVDGGEIRRTLAYFNPVAPLRQIGAIVVESAPIPDWPSQPEIVKLHPDNKNEDLIKQFYATWEAGNFEGFQSVFAENPTVRNRAVVSVTEGLAGVQEHLEGKSQLYKGLAYDIESMHSAGDYVVTRVNLKGTRALVPDGAKEPVDKPIVIPEVHVFKLTDGKVTELSFYYDELHEYKQFGYTMATVITALSEKNAKTKSDLVKNTAETGTSAADGNVQGTEKAQPGSAPGPQNESDVRALEHRKPEK